MAGITTNPRVWDGSDLLVAPVGTALPTSLTAEMSTVPDWEPVGLLSEDGASEARDEDSTDLYSWGGNLVRTVRSKHKRTIKATALEDNPVVFGLVNPGSTATTTTGVTTRTVKVPHADKRAFVLELHDSAGVTKRRHIWTGEVTEVGETTLSDADMQAFELTITVYPDATGSLYEDITDDPQAVVEA